MSALLLLLAAAQPLAAQDVPSGFRDGDAGLVHQASAVACPDVLLAGGVPYLRNKVSQAGWRASCLYLNSGDGKVTAAFSIDIAPVPGATSPGPEADKMLDVTALLLTRNAPAETVTQVSTGVFTVKRAPGSGKVERYVATRRGGWMVNYSGVSTPSRETSLAEAIDTFARTQQTLGTTSSFASLPK